MARRHSLLRVFLLVYCPGALVLLCVVASCDLRGSFFNLDSYDWQFRNTTRQEVLVTPLYTGPDGREHVVPRDGWDQTEFRFGPGESRKISLETGDFPFHRILVEPPTGPSWTVSIDANPVLIVTSTTATTASQRAAKVEPTIRRLKLYPATAAVPLAWSLPVVLLVALLRHRSTRRRGID